jgi:hypothetical protein
MFRVGLMALVIAAAGITRVSGQEPKPLPRIEVTDPKDVASVRGLLDTLQALSEKVTACVTSGGSPESCRCAYPKELTNLRGGYAGLLKQHPAWKDQNLSYQFLKDGRNSSGVLAMETLKRQLDVLKCD